MAGPGDVRAGGAYVEIDADNSKLKKSLQDSERDFKKYRDAAMRISSGVETPLEKLKKKLEEVKELGRKGWLDPETTRRAIVQIKQQASELRSAADSVKAPIQKMKEAMSGGGGAGKAKGGDLQGLAALKKSFGEESAFGQVMKMASFAGPLAAIGLVIQQINRMSERVADLSTQYRSGQIAYQDYVNEMIKSVPAIGLVVGTIENIGEAITGTKFKAAQYRANQVKGREIIDGAGFQGDGFDAEGAEARARRIEAGLNTKNLTPLERAKLEASGGYTDRIAEINAGRKSAVDAVREKNQKQIDDLRGIVNAPRGKVSDLQRAEANSKLEQIQIEIEREIGRIKKAAEREIAANRKAREAAIAEVEQRGVAEYVAKAMAGFGGFVLGGGGGNAPTGPAALAGAMGAMAGGAIQQMLKGAKAAVTLSSANARSVGGYGGDLTGLSSEAGIKQVTTEILKAAEQIVKNTDGGAVKAGA